MNQGADQGTPSMDEVETATGTALENNLPNGSEYPQRMCNSHAVRSHGGRLINTTTKQKPAS